MDLDTLLPAIMAFIREHRSWAGPLVLVLAFCESLAFVSLVLPAWGLLVAIGTVLGATGSADFWYIVVCAGIGAALGDWLSYWLGYHYSESIAKMWPFTRYPDLLPQGRKFFDKWGSSAIWLGRFTGPLRASVPIIAGTVRMPGTSFQIANWGSAFLWAFVLMQFGDVLGRLWQAFHRNIGG